MSEHLLANQPENSASNGDEQQALIDFNLQLNAKIDPLPVATAKDALKATAAAAMQETDRASISLETTKDSPERARVDSAQQSSESVPQLPPDQRSPPSGQSSPPLRLKTASTQSDLRSPPSEDTIANSPTLRKHAIPIEEGTANTLPAVQPTSPTDHVATSPNSQSLPSFRQLTGQLTELAEVATQQDPRVPPAPQHQHSQSFGSATAQSPMMPYYTPFTNSAQTSPTTYHGFGPRSPTSTISESHHYGSPQQYATAAYYPDRRRSSALTEPGPPLFPPPVPSLPSNSSGESHGHAGSSTDGYSTAQTTPIDPSIPIDGMQRPILPPPPGMSVIPAGGFKCDYPGCNAVPFQTQYLLSSHRNVHSQNRPHYCPVKECPRSEGGKGFKRKNEMIRHGLVHNSPGYICPFCPDREHRYPRPDNLQRHVRVHHVDKDRDDPALREVLAQRQEGAGKQRRRRTQSSNTQ
ncbi:hypothetical protein AC578_5390 [Pseudocercospora eumusae]|uniref:C2H2-type domain-containing protein n=1 Tax=Pseudocercospora eumusae TaxID=321146 RepID=A0A139HJZ4_9PEZI|nr:hypothetical protein AC578_5390 [Pseudocercospora eumusae]